MPVRDASEISDLPPAFRARLDAQRRPADALGDMPAGMLAARTVPLSASQCMLPADAPLVAQCKPCARVHHDECERRLGIGPCACYVCHKNMIVADAERALASGDPRAVRDALQLTLILLAQRSNRDRARELQEPRPAGKCACGCGRTVIKLAMGTEKLYALPACRKKIQMRRYRARIKAGTVGPAPPQLPAPARGVPVNR
jgi:hypothetical protein